MMARKGKRGASSFSSSRDRQESAFTARIQILTDPILSSNPVSDGWS